VDVSYTIEPRAVTDFLKERLELPVFQRAPSWKERQNFNLLLSVFKGFPIGVVVVSAEGTGTRRVLLDGRQRREALLRMTDPEAITHWAFRTLRLRGKRLSRNASSEEWKDAFWARVEEFLGNPDSSEPASVAEEDHSTVPELDEPDEVEVVEDESYDDRADDDESDSPIEGSDASAVAPESLSLRNLQPMEELLQLLLLSRKRAFSHLFDFRDELGEHPKLKYVAHDASGTDAVSTALLSDWLRTSVVTKGDSEDVRGTHLFDALNDEYVVLDAERLRDRIEGVWPELAPRIRAVVRLEGYLRRTRLGYIEVAAPSSADEMKIFELINTGGTPLTSAEILSAKRDWNIEVPDAPGAVRTARINLYQESLKIAPRDSVVRRWDVAATTVQRLSLPWVFGTFNTRKKPQFESQTILGFQLYAGAYLGRLMKDDLGELGPSLLLGGVEPCRVFAEERDECCGRARFRAVGSR
jgi:hypothetical protein